MSPQHVRSVIIWQERQCTYERNFETRSRHRCCRGKAIGITYSVCVCVALSGH